MALKSKPGLATNPYVTATGGHSDAYWQQWAVIEEEKRNRDAAAKAFLQQQAEAEAARKKALDAEAEAAALPDKIKNRDEQNKSQSSRRQTFSGLNRGGTVLTGGLGLSAGNNAQLGIKKTLLGQ